MLFTVSAMIRDIVHVYKEVWSAEIDGVKEIDILLQHVYMIIPEIINLFLIVSENIERENFDRSLTKH